MHNFLTSCEQGRVTLSIIISKTLILSELHDVVPDLLPSIMIETIT